MTSRSSSPRVPALGSGLEGNASVGISQTLRGQGEYVGNLTEHAGPYPYTSPVMGESKGDRLTRIEQLLEAINTQTSELHRLALSAAEPKAVPKKPEKPRVRRNG